MLVIWAALALGADYWNDGQQAPVETAGTAQVRSRASMATYPALLQLTLPSGQIMNFELNNILARELNSYLRQLQTNQVVIEHSPQFKSVYTIRAGERQFTNYLFKPGLLYQDWQRTSVYLLLGVGLIGLAGLIFSLLALLDWRLKPRQLLGALISRVERTEGTSGEYRIIVRSSTPGLVFQFELNEADFLATDGADFVEIVYAPLFKYVWQLRPVSLSQLPGELGVILAGLAGQKNRLSYAPRWRLQTFLYSDIFFAVVLFTLTLGLLLSYTGNWSNLSADFSQWSLIPMFVTIFGVIAFYLLLRFRSKWRDMRAPKRLISGPVLSKWRVASNGPSNRHLIVVANGGLQAGEQAVCKFDLHPVVFDQLRVGDIIEIEHTPNLRFICRLEVTGHQELTQTLSSG